MDETIYNVLPHFLIKISPNPESPNKTKKEKYAKDGFGPYKKLRNRRACVTIPFKEINTAINPNTLIILFSIKAIYFMLK
jgi:hypothetical protein